MQDIIKNIDTQDDTVLSALISLRDISQFIVYRDIDYDKSISKLEKLIKHVKNENTNKYLKK